VPLGSTSRWGSRAATGRRGGPPEIAARVREDVLALRAPAPPVPGPAPRPVRVAVCACAASHAAIFPRRAGAAGADGYTLRSLRAHAGGRSRGRARGLGRAFTGRRAWPSLWPGSSTAGGARAPASRRWWSARGGRGAGARAHHPVRGHGRQTRSWTCWRFAEATFYAGKFDESGDAAPARLPAGSAGSPWPVAPVPGQGDEVWLLNVLDLVRPPPPTSRPPALPAEELSPAQARLQEAYAFVGGALRRRVASRSWRWIPRQRPPEVGEEIEAALGGTPPRAGAPAHLTAPRRE
jgi:hypothetical protein